MPAEFNNRRKSRSRRGNEAELFFAPKSASSRRRLPLTLSKHARILVDGRGSRINMQRLIVGSIEAWRKKHYGSESCD